MAIQYRKKGQMQQLIHNATTKFQDDIPCIKCVTLAICKSQCQNAVAFYMRVIPKCTIIREYLNICSWTAVTFSCNKGDNIEAKVETVKRVLGIPVIRVYHGDKFKDVESINDPIQEIEVPCIEIHTGKQPLITEKEREDMIKAGSIKVTEWGMDEHAKKKIWLPISKDK